MEITRHDCDTLIEALDAWESKDAAGDMMGAMLGGLFIKTDEDRDKWQAEEAKRQAASDAKRKVRKERSVMLKAKLIEMRNSMTADQILEDAAK